MLREEVCLNAFGFSDAGRVGFIPPTTYADITVALTKGL